ncbi:MAG: hypothetical protein WCJ87_03160 [Burkholderiales bacterium]
MKAPKSALALLALLVAVALSLPPGRQLIEQSMVWHMAVQMPLLLAAGWLSADATSKAPTWRWTADCNRYGLTGLLAAQVILAYWMLPSAIDRAVVSPLADTLKVMTLVACGALLRRCVSHAPAVLQLFLVGSAVPMTVWLGVYFATTDRRLCNAYTLASQASAGIGIAVWGLAVAAAWVVVLLRQAASRAPEMPAARSHVGID